MYVYGPKHWTAFDELGLRGAEYAENFSTFQLFLSAYSAPLKSLR